MLLLAGTPSVVVSGLFTLTHLADAVVFPVLLPGFVSGLFLLTA